MRTITQMMTEAIACTTSEEARALVNDEAAALVAVSPQLLDEEARETILKNIGYMTGYLDRSEAARILDIFRTRHPYFGAIEDWPTTAEETIALGMKMGSRSVR